MMEFLVFFNAVVNVEILILLILHINERGRK